MLEGDLQKKAVLDKENSVEGVEDKEKVVATPLEKDELKKVIEPFQFFEQPTTPYNSGTLWSKVLKSHWVRKGIFIIHNCDNNYLFI